MISSIPRASALACLVAVCATNAFAQDATNLVAQAREALARGDNAAGVALSSKALEQDPTNASVLLTRSLALYRQGDLGAAEADLTAAMAPSAASSDDPAGYRWPPDFLNWVATVRAAYAPNAEIPHISLDDLDVEVATTAVTAHFVMDVEIVRIPVIVEDFEGGFMAGLTAADFGVVDGAGEPKGVRELIQEDAPTSIGILIDASASMVDKADAVRNAMVQILESTKPEDEIFLAQYADEARFLSDFSTDRVALAAAMASYETGNRRAMRDALALGLIRMRSAQHEKKALIVVADGDDEGSRTSEEQVALAARREGVAIHAILVMPEGQRWRPTYEEAAPPETSIDGSDDGSSSTDAAAAANADVATEAPAEEPGDEKPEFVAGHAGLLQEMSHNTGGLVAVRPVVEERYGGFEDWLKIACTDLGTYMSNQYLLLYRSTQPPPRGEWRDLRVQIGPLHKRVRARSGYVR